MHDAVSGVSDLVGAVIAAAGAAVRMGSDKMRMPLGGRPLLASSVEVIGRSPLVDKLVVVVAEQNLSWGEELMRQLGLRGQVCAGGANRRESVLRGLLALGPCDMVVVHDGARPFPSEDLIARGLTAVRLTGAATAAMPLRDTVKAVANGRVVSTLDRERLWAVQTPQVFRYDLILAAHRSVPGQTFDDATLVELMGHPVDVYEGSVENIKVTTPEDLDLAEAIYRRRYGELG